jgi:hypothetical protein
VKRAYKNKVGKKAGAQYKTRTNAEKYKERVSEASNETRSTEHSRTGGATGTTRRG